MNENIPPLIETYRIEYIRTTGKQVFCCSYSRGWFRVGDTTRVRRAEFLKMIETLKGRHTVYDRIENVNDVPTTVKAHQHVVQNLLSGEDVIEDRDTPLCCSVASETYWSM
jgi:hypothetical protein